MVALDELNDVNAQVWNGISWASSQITTADTTSTRGGVGAVYENVLLQ